MSFNDDRNFLKVDSDFLLIILFFGEDNNMNDENTSMFIYHCYKIFFIVIWIML